MIRTFNKNSSIRNGEMVSMIPVRENEGKIGNTVNYLDFLSYEPIGNSNVKDYIVRYYNDVLSKLDPEELLKTLRFTVLVSDETVDSISIRNIVSEWLNLFCDERVTESKTLKDGTTVEVKRPEIIKNTLEEIIKNSKDMRGFESLRGLYLFEKSEKLLEKAEELESLTGKDFKEIKERAFYLRGNALETENRYKFKDTFVHFYSKRKSTIRKR